MTIAPDSNRDQPGTYTTTLIARLQDFPGITENQASYIFTVTIPCAMIVQETTPIELMTYIPHGSNQVSVDYEIVQNDGSCEVSMYSDKNGTPLDPSDEQYFDIYD